MTIINVATTTDWAVIGEQLDFHYWVMLLLFIFMLVVWFAKKFINHF